MQKARAFHSDCSLSIFALRTFVLFSQGFSIFPPFSLLLLLPFLYSLFTLLSFPAWSRFSSNPPSTFHQSSTCFCSTYPLRSHLCSRRDFEYTRYLVILKCLDVSFGGIEDSLSLPQPLPPSNKPNFPRHL